MEVLQLPLRRRYEQQAPPPSLQRPLPLHTVRAGGSADRNGRAEGDEPIERRQLLG